MGWSCHHFVPVTWVFYSLIFPQWGTVDYGMSQSPLCPSDMGLLLLMFPQLGYCGLWDDPVTTLSRWHGSSTPYVPTIGVLWTMGWACHHFDPVTWVFYSLIFQQWGTVVTQKWRFPSVENRDLTNILPVKHGVAQHIARHASPNARHCQTCLTCPTFYLPGPFTFFCFL